MKSQQSAAFRHLEQVLGDGKYSHGSPGDETSKSLAELLAEVDLLESFLAGVLSSRQLITARQLRLVDEQFSALHAQLSTMEEDSKIEMIQVYVSNLAEAYNNYRQEIDS